MGSGVSKTRVGSFKGTAATVNVTGVEFRPRVVHIYNTGGLAHGTWVEGMADASILKTITAGTVSLPLTLGITPTSQGFNVGADTDLNVAGEQVFWVAHE